MKIRPGNTLLLSLPFLTFAILAPTAHGQGPQSVTFELSTTGLPPNHIPSGVTRPYRITVRGTGTFQLGNYSYSVLEENSVLVDETIIDEIDFSVDVAGQTWERVFIVNLSCTESGFFETTTEGTPADPAEVYVLVESTDFFTLGQDLARSSVLELSCTKAPIREVTLAGPSTLPNNGVDRLYSVRIRGFAPVTDYRWSIQDEDVGLDDTLVSIESFSVADQGQWEREFLTVLNCTDGKVQGDGGSSGEGEPSDFAEVYALVEEEDGDDAAGSVRINVECGGLDEVQATCTPRNGSGVNPTGFACVNAPVIGQTWEKTVDLPSVDDHFSVVAISLGGPLTGLVLPSLGELLCLPPIDMSDVGFGAHSIAISNDTAILGLSFSTQAVTISFDSPRDIQLQNAIDVMVGGSPFG